jgi:hypothetical protein
MNVPIEIWLRGDNHATTEALPGSSREPRAWTDADVADVLVGMLRAIDRAKNPDTPQNRPVSFRGFSWIVNPFEGGVLIAIEMTLGAVVAGPFDIGEGQLTAMIHRVVSTDRPATTVH